MFNPFTNFQLGLLFSVLPIALIYLWALITGDFMNFLGSRTKVLNYVAQDPVNCYQNYAGNKNGDVRTAT